MVRKLNRKAAEAYSEDFSSRVLDDFFSAKMVATGQDVLELTPVQQVNLLIIQRLYVRWQEEILRLRSPYFNFEHPQVQESLQAFMNTLSRHIQVERSALEPLLKAAVLDTLRLLFNPMAFFDEFLKQYTKPESLQASLRYLRMQQPLTDVLYEQVGEKDTTEGEYLLAILEAGLRSGKIELEPVDEHVEAFEKVLPLPYDLVDEPQVAAAAPAAPPKEEESSDFFSAISRMAPRQEARRNEPRQMEPRVEPRQNGSQHQDAKAENRPKEAAPAKNTIRVEAIQPVTTRSHFDDEPVTTAPSASTTRATEQANPDFTVDHPKASPSTPAPNLASTPEPAEPSLKTTSAASTISGSSASMDTGNALSIGRQEEENGTLNKRFEKNEKKPLYEKFESKESRSSSIAQKQRSTNIRHYITLNQRFMFVKELFAGDTEAFNASLNQLDACQNMPEAQQWVQKHLAHKPQWQEDSEIVQEFERVLNLRFGS